MKTELRFTYDQNMRPISAVCTGCGERMESSVQPLQHAGDAVVWFAQQFIKHKQLKHSDPAPDSIECE